MHEAVTPESPGRPSYRAARFLTSAAKLAQCPPDTGWEVAFAGRSNAGKSSAINSLTGNRKLARTSRTPGRTQLINFFELSDSQRLVDLPGYGFARVSESMRRHWGELLADYFESRRSLAGLILIVDIRRKLKEFDRRMIEFAESVGLPIHILLTKADKLKRGPAQSTLLSVRAELSAQSELISVQLFSSLKRQGVDELRRQLNQWLTDDSVFGDAPDESGSE